MAMSTTAGMGYLSFLLIATAATAYAWAWQQQLAPQIPSRSVPHPPPSRSPAWGAGSPQTVSVNGRQRRRRQMRRACPRRPSSFVPRAEGGDGGEKFGGDSRGEGKSGDGDDNPPDLFKLLDQVLKAGGDSNVGITIENLDDFGGMLGGEGGGGSANAADEERSAAGLEALRSFDLRPREVVEFLDRYVIRQGDAKKVLAVAVCDHYNHCRRCIDATESEGEQVEYAKPNILLAGPTGVGKTYLLKCIARLIGVPFAKGDATKFSETGIVGRDAEDLVRDLVSAAGGNATLAQYGIIYIDEVDKIAAGGAAAGSGRATAGDFNTRGVQNNFLKLLEDTDVSLRGQGPMAIMGMGGIGGGGGEQTINTRNILFIFSGAFTGLDADIRRKMEKKPFGLDIDIDDKDDYDETNAGAGVVGGGGLGFVGPGIGGGGRTPKKKRSYLKHAETADFVRAGLEPEFVGRVPVRVALESLDADDLKEILVNAEGSVLKQFVRDFSGYGINMTATDGALTRIAELAEDEATGARGLVTVLERSLRNHKYELPSSSIRSFVLDRETVDSPLDGLRALLSSQTRDDELGVILDDLKRWERRLNRGIAPLTAWLTDEAIDYLAQLTMERSDVASAYSLAQRRFEDLPAAIRKVGEKTGQRQYPISLTLAKEPTSEIDSWLNLVEGDSASESIADR